MTRPALLLFSLVGALVSGVAMAQAPAPSTEAMIERLKQPRTRSLRNLVPEAAPIAAPAEAAAGATAADAAPGAAPVESGNSDSGASAPAGTATASAPAAAIATPSAVAAEPPRPSLSLQIQFDFDSARVRPESRQALANLSQALLSTELRGSRFAVEGHTDAKGSADYNLRLSAQRALAVRDVLKSLGVDEARLQASGKGASDLENSADPFAAQNRRVRIVNLE